MHCIIVTNPLHNCYNSNTWVVTPTKQLVAGYWGGICGSLQQHQISQPISDLRHQKQWEDLSPRGAQPGGNEDLGGRHLHGGRRLSGVRPRVVAAVRTTSCCPSPSGRFKLLPEGFRFQCQPGSFYEITSVMVLALPLFRVFIVSVNYECGLVYCLLSWR